MSHNQQLDALLTKVRKVATGAKEEKDFAPAFALLRDFRNSVGPIKYDNAAKWIAFAVIAAVAAVFCGAYVLMPDLQRTLDVWGYGIMGAFAVGLIGLLIAIGVADSGIDEVSDLIFEKDIFFDNGLKEQSVSESKGRKLYRQFHEEFGDFRERGEEGRYVESLVSGKHAGQEYSFPYDYYVFHYVHVYYVTVTHTDGKKTWTTVERRTETLYRYGLILDFPFAKGIVAGRGGGSYDYPEEFEPTSQRFNSDFAVGAESSIAAAKFLKPAVVLAFEELAEWFDDLNVEINREGKMNIAFEDDDVLDLGRKHSIAQPDEFEKEIQSQLELPKLRRLLQFVEMLKKHNDSNF